ncbi:RICIN domain-containing protein, partial [Streptomyces sp. SID8455]|nr:RICIN domain-containing protein [Streptomyces sp. SID8455]
LGVDGMSTADSAHVVQYDDNGTADHLWRLL